MKLFPIDKILQVGDFLEIDNHLYFCNEFSIVVLNCLTNSKRKIELKILESYWGVNFRKDYFHVFTAKSLNHIYDYNGKLLLERDNCNFYEILSLENILYYDRINKSSRLSNSSFEIKGKINQFVLGENRIMYITNNFKNKVCSYSFSSNMHNWIRELINFNKIANIFQTRDNFLFIASIKGDIYIVNTVDGTIIFNFSIINKFPTSKDNFYNFSMPFLYHENSKKIIWLTNQSLFEIDMQTQSSTLIKDYREMPREEQWRFMTSTIQGDYIYFTGDLGWEYVTASRIGVMNALTGEVLWQQQIKKTGGLPNAPKVSNKRLYVLTAKGDLHIFEKNEMIL